VGQVYLHIGLHKTGTTYVQQLLRANRKPLRRHGVFYAGGKGLPHQVFAVWDLLGRRPETTGDARISGSWQGLVDAINAADDRTAVISDEHLSLAGAKQARAAVGAFPERDVHVVVTVRDLGRTLVSSWQEAVKNRDTSTWADFMASVRDPARAGANPARAFWLRQDLPVILGVWAKEVPVERIHVVTVPPPGAARDLLVQRLGSVIGFDQAALPKQAPWANESVGVVGTELIRRLNPRLEHLPRRRYDRAVKRVVVRELAGGAGVVPFAIPDRDLAWARARGAVMVAEIRQRGYDVVGDLAELDPRPTRGRAPDQVSTDELLDNAMTALAGLSDAYAGLWWDTRGPEAEFEVDASARMSSRARAVAFRGRRAVARLADRNAVAGRVLGTVLRRRGR
jgi:hypothetical protein